VNDKYEHKETGEKLEVWHKEKGEDSRALRFNENHDEKGQFASGSSELYEKTFGKVGDVKTADEVVSSVGNKQAADVLKSRGGMDATFTLKEIPVGSVRPSNGVEKGRLKEFTAKTTEAPPIVAYEGEVIDGNGRLAAAKMRGETTIKAYVGYKNEESERALRFNENHDEKGQFTSGDTGRWDVSDSHAEFNETNKSRLESGEYKIVKVAASKVSVDTVYPDRVKQYAEQMKNGDKFPMPVGKTDDGGKTFWSPNGNHRIAAAKSLGDEHLYLMVKKSEVGERSLRFNDNHDDKGQFASGAGGTYTYPVSVNDKSFVHQQVFDSKMDEALKSGSVESYAAFKAASDSMSGNMASMSLSEIAKNDAVA